MKCPRCNSPQDKVIDSRSSEGGRSIRRRRECIMCHTRWTTYEVRDTSDDEQTRRSVERLAWQLLPGGVRDGSRGMLEGDAASRARRTRSSD